MRATVFKPKYSLLPKFKVTAWNLVKDKNFKHKKWQFLETENSFKTPKVFAYYQKEVSQIIVNFRYHYREQLNSRLYIRYVYGRLQHYKLKQLCLKNKKKPWINYIRILEQSPTSILYRLHLVSSYNEALTYQKNNYIHISENSDKKKVQKYTIIDFYSNFKILIKRRIILNYLRVNEYTISNMKLYPDDKDEKKTKNPKKKVEVKTEILLKRKLFYIGIHQCVDFEPNSFRFLFLDNIKYFKNHPFRIPFENILRWYTRV